MISIPRLQKTFGQVLKELRNENGLSQQQLAFDSALGTIFKLAEVLKLSPSDMVTRVEKSLKRK
jgi:transcriptional regulator with XRE-family HTH domain